MSKRAGLCSAVVAITLLAGCAGQQSRQMWDAEAVARSPNPTTRLLNAKQEQVGEISTATAATYVTVKHRVEEAASLSGVRLMIVAGEDPNAFATISNGLPLVAFNVAMISLLGVDRDAIAAIMGHEMAHLKLHHGAKRLERESARKAGATVLGFALGLVGVPLGGTLADLATTAIATSYTRDEERDADKLGMEFADRAGYSSEGAVRAFSAMARKSGGPSIPFLSTHPGLTERIETAKAHASAATARSSPPLPEPTEAAAPTPQQPNTTAVVPTATVTESAVGVLQAVTEPSAAPSSAPSPEPVLHEAVRCRMPDESEVTVPRVHCTSQQGLVQ